MTPRFDGERAAVLVGAAAAGDPRAWEQLVDAYGALIWAIARNHRLDAADAADVSQTAWLRLLEHIDRLDDPDRVGAWLATTARRECLRVIQRRARSVSVADASVYADATAPTQPEVDAAMLGQERDAEVQRAVRELVPRCRNLLHLLMLDPPPSYEEVSAALGMPVGSIGPTRSRCLARLQLLLTANGADGEHVPYDEAPARSADP